MTERTYNTRELVDQLYSNLRTLAPAGAEYSYIAGYLYNTLAQVAEHGIDELVENVNWTNQRVESLGK